MDTAIERNIKIKNLKVLYIILMLCWVRSSRVTVRTEGCLPVKDKSRLLFFFLNVSHIIEYTHSEEK